MKVLARIFLVAFLTLVTQIGGLLFLLAWIGQHLRPQKQGLILYFVLSYGVAWLALPFLARPLGRVPLPLRATTEQPLRPQNYLMVLANRHYVRPELKEATLRVARKFQQEAGIPLTYLDANFPFADGFPLLPHRSHDDGQKIDLAFVYQKKKQLTTRAPALWGYGRCAGPRSGEQDQASRCASQGFWQYSLLEKAASPFLGDRYQFQPEATAGLIHLLAQEASIQKLFLEPHLKQRLGLGQLSKIRFHGCAAVRHDDHVHIQL